MPRLVIALLAAALCAPAAASAKDLPASGWDVRLQSKLTYTYDQHDPETVRRASGTAMLDVKQVALLLPKRKGQTDREAFGSELQGRQTPGALQYTFGDRSCSGFLTAGGGERAIGDRDFRAPKPSAASRKLDVVKEGIAIPFGRVSTYVRCSDEGIGVPTLSGERDPHVLPIPANAAAKRKLKLRATGWHAYAPCGAQDDYAGTGTPPAHIDTPEGPCALEKVLTEELTLTLTRRCRTAKVRREYGVLITDCRKGS